MTEELRQGTEVKTMLIVNYKANAKTEDFKESKKGLKFKKEEKLKYIHQDILTFETEEEALKAKEKLEKSKNVVFVDFEREGEGEPLSVTNDYLASTWNYHMRPNPNIPNDNFNWLTLKEINDSIEEKEETLLAIIDDGFLTTHPDLKGKLVKGYNAYSSLTEEAGGKIYINNSLFHGTMVAGMAVALTNNGLSSSSVGSLFDNLKVLPISVYNDEGTSRGTGTFGRAINYVVEQVVEKGRNIVAINLSWGGFGSEVFREPLEKAYDKGIAIFASAGNSGLDNTLKPYYPANHPTVYAVGSIDSDMKTLSVFDKANNKSSSYGTSAFVGNGGNIIQLKMNGKGDVNNYGGTSSSSPHVASIYTAMKAVAPSLSREEIIDIMIKTAHDCGDSHKFGYGYPNAVEAIRIARILGGDIALGSGVESTLIPDKSWIITLTKDVEPTKTKGVYIIDEYGKKHDTTVVTSGTRVTVIPKYVYDIDKKYYLVVTDLYSTTGERLSANVAKAFRRSVIV